MTEGSARSGQRTRRSGFKRWFERQLIESHVYLVTCRAYARFSVVDSARHDAVETGKRTGISWLRVKCQKCGNEWTIT